MRHKDTRHNKGADNEIGPEGMNPNNGLARGRIELTDDLVKRAEAKLVDLHASRSQLRRRIKALHYLLKTIDVELTNSEPTAPISQLPTRESAFNPVERRESNSDTVAASPIPTKEPATSAPAPPGSTELRRACRIALIESDRPQSCEQILLRIRRRESVCIEVFHDPLNAVAKELGEMLADGEVIQKTNDQLWQLNRDSCRFIGRTSSAGK